MQTTIIQDRFSANSFSPPTRLHQSFYCALQPFQRPRPTGKLTNDSLTMVSFRSGQTHSSDFIFSRSFGIYFVAVYYSPNASLSPRKFSRNAYAFPQCMCIFGQHVSVLHTMERIMDPFVFEFLFFKYFRKVRIIFVFAIVYC